MIAAEFDFATVVSAYGDGARAEDWLNECLDWVLMLGAEKDTVIVAGDLSWKINHANRERFKWQSAGREANDDTGNGAWRSHRLQRED